MFRQQISKSWYILTYFRNFDIKYWLISAVFRNIHIASSIMILQNIDIDIDKEMSKYMKDLYELNIFCDALPGLIPFVPILCVMSIQIPGRKILSEFLPVKLDRIKLVRFSSYTTTSTPLIHSIRKKQENHPFREWDNAYFWKDGALEFLVQISGII